MPKMKSESQSQRAPRRRYRRVSSSGRSFSGSADASGAVDLDDDFEEEDSGDLEGVVLPRNAGSSTKRRRRFNSAAPESDSSSSNPEEEGEDIPSFSDSSNFRFTTKEKMLKAYQWHRNLRVPVSRIAVSLGVSESRVYAYLAEFKEMARKQVDLTDPRDAIATEQASYDHIFVSAMRNSEDRNASPASRNAALKTALAAKNSARESLKDWGVVPANQYVKSIDKTQSDLGLAETLFSALRDVAATGNLEGLKALSVEQEEMEQDPQELVENVIGMG